MLSTVNILLMFELSKFSVNNIVLWIHLSMLTIKNLISIHSVSSFCLFSTCFAFPLETTVLFSMFMACFGLVCSFILCLVFMFLIWMKSYGICLYLSDLFLLIMISSRSVLVVTIGKISFLFYSWVVFHCVCVCVCVCDIFFIHSSVDGHRVVSTSWLL